MLLDDNGVALKNQLNATYSAFHLAEQKGLFGTQIQLKPIFEAPLAQRRHHKRSTSSNASSESNLSSNSICSSLSTSTSTTTQTATQCQPQAASSYTTPTKKCPSSCGKQQEPCVFDFADAYVTEYLQQQQQQHEQSANSVFNRPITRSITHHNSRLGAVGGDEAGVASVPDVAVALAVAVAVPVSVSTGAESTALPVILPAAASSTNLLDVSTPLLNPPPCKRQKRCSTILID